MKMTSCRPRAVAVGFTLLVLLMVVLTWEFAKAETLTSSSLGSEWKCHRLPYIQICDHIVQRPR
jgi:hypothetical protein